MRSFKGAFVDNFIYTLICLFLLSVGPKQIQIHLFRYSLCHTSYAAEEYCNESQRYRRYDAVLCNLLKTLYDRGEHKET